MKKVVSVLLTLSLTLSCMGAAFADTTVSDISGTPYEEAVENLMDKGVFSGYPDGTFKAENPITRAEICSMLVHALAPTQEQLNAAPAGKFSDLSGNHWAADYINYAADNAIVNGYEDGTFRPGNQVTYYEMAAMLINAMGIKAYELTGQWPDNYAGKAEELGLFENIVIQGSFDGNAAATRGNVAIMTNRVVDKIIEAGKTETPDVTPEDPDQEQDSDQGKDDQPSGTVSEGKLADYSGRAYGIIVDVADVLDQDGDTVQQLTFLFGNDIEYLVTKDHNTFDGDFKTDGSLDCLRMRDGVVIEIQTANVNKNYVEFTDENAKEVKEVSNRVVTFENGKSFTISSDASVYMVSDGDYEFEVASVRDIEEGCLVRLYGITEDASPNGPVEVVVITQLAK